MVSLLVIALATMLVVGGTAVSVFLHTRSLSGVSHFNSMRVSAADDAMSRYARNALATLLFALVIAAMVLASIVNGLVR